MPKVRVRPLLRRLGLIATLPILTAAVWLSAAGPTFACSCVAPGPMTDYDTAEYAVFSGIAGSLDGRGVPVHVTTWYHGTRAAPLVYLAKTSFGDSAACGTTAPVAGSGWIWVTWLPEDGGDPGTGLCSPSAQLGTPEGNAMVADATATFGGAPPPGVDVDPPDAAAGPTVPPDAAVPVLLGTLVISVVLFVVVAALARRRPRSA
jgi:hypothetical protein